MTPNRRKAWVDQLLTKEKAIGRALGMPLGKMLGCGHWGCVFESTAPWVVKLSIDPTEGPIWSKIGNVVADEDYGGDGFVELKSITRILPDITVGGKKRKVWAIVREGVEPVFREWTQKELGERGRGTRILTTTFTNHHLSLSAPESAYMPLRRGMTPLQEDFWAGIEGLFKYRDLATLWHLFGARHTAMNRDRKESLLRQQRLPETGATRDDVEERIDRVIGHYFRGASMGPLGESLGMLSSNHIYLRDVHSQNIGWHVRRSDDDWTRVVVFDPGHTPTEKTEIEGVLVENPREAL